MNDSRKLSFMRSLCLGEIAEEVILPFPTINREESETLGEVIHSIEALLKPHEKDFATWDTDGEFPEAYVTELKEFGLFSLVIPEAHGGLGFGSGAYSRALQEVATYDSSTAVTVGAHSSIGMRGLLLFGTEEQKARYLPKLATGELVAAFCLTESTAGSDAASIKTTAVREGDQWKLNGSKLWITNGGIADFFTVFARTGQAGEKGQMSAFIVTRDMAGVQSGPHDEKMGIRASSTTTVTFDDVLIPAENVLGEIGKGFKVAMSILNNGRTGLGGGSVGGMKRLIRLCTAQATERRQFGRPISDFGLMKEKVGQMAVDCYATEALVSMVAGLIDQKHEDYAVEAAISKVFASEALARTADEALQIAGGNGFMKEFPYERIVRDSRINRIFEGTNEVLRLFIALNGMNDAGQELKELSSGLQGVFNDPIKGFGVMSDYALKRASWATGFSRPEGRFTRLHPSLKREGVIFEELTHDLATATDRLLRKHGKGIIDKQLATKRLADMMIQLFTLACVLSRVDSRIREADEASTKWEQQIARAFAHRAQAAVKTAFNGIDDNEDEVVKALADHLFEEQRYPWDTL